MSNENSKDVVLSDTIFTPVMDVKTATQGFKDFQKLKMEILQESDISSIMGKPHVKKSGWNKLALFFGASTRTVASKKTHNPDGSYEWEVTGEVSAEEMEGHQSTSAQEMASECGCAAKDTKPSDDVNGKGQHQCLNCRKPINEIRYNQISKIIT